MQHFYLNILFQSNVLELRVDLLTDQHQLKMKSMIISPSVEVISKILHYLNPQGHIMAYPLILSSCKYARTAIFMPGVVSCKCKLFKQVMLCPEAYF